MKNILVATDGSPNANRAIESAARLAAAFGGRLKIVHIVRGYDPVPEGLLDLSRAEHVTPPELLGALSEQCLAAALTHARRHGASEVRVESRTGDVAGCILHVACEDQPDLIVIGKRGLGRLAGLFLGSVSQKIVSLAEHPVLVVP
jgi:nucleotide-binding universal stress UspA family protein